MRGVAGMHACIDRAEERYLELSSWASLAARRTMRSSRVPMGNQQATSARLAASISLFISSRPRFSAHSRSSCNQKIPRSALKEGCMGTLQDPAACCQHANKEICYLSCLSRMQRYPPALLLYCRMPLLSMLETCGLNRPYAQAVVHRHLSRLS